MSKKCDVCGKQPTFGNSVARLGKGAMIRRVKARTPRRFNPNIQPIRAIIKGTTDASVARSLYARYVGS